MMSVEHTDASFLGERSSAYYTALQQEQSMTDIDPNPNSHCTHDVFTSRCVLLAHIHLQIAGILL